MLEFTPHPDADYRHNYPLLVEEINDAVAAEDHPAYFELIRKWSRKDLFFLLYFVLRVNLNHPWLVERIKEVEDCNDRTLDLWSREHWKSTIMTYGLNIQEILRNPEIRIGIFSHTRKLAAAFLHRIKVTFETNLVLKTAFSDIYWSNPGYESPRWSLDEGIIVKRSGVYHEATVEANGLIDGMPTGKHYDVLHYDDVVTRESVTTPAQLEKVDDCFKLSFNLGAIDHLTGEKGKMRVIGTPYHFNDQYAKMEKEGGWTVRKRKCIDEDGEPVLLSREMLDEKRVKMGPHVYACQMLLDPREAGKNKFSINWIRYYKDLPDNLNLYLLVDPANEKKYQKTGSDFTCFWLWGLDAFGNYFWVNGVREKLNLTERWDTLVWFCKKYPRIIRIGYEQYGMQADLQFFAYMSDKDNIYLPHIQELGGKMRKEDRILRLLPAFEQGRVYLPKYLMTPDGDRDLVQEFITEEYSFFPYAPHDDMLDAASRIEDVEMSAYRPYFPETEDGQGGDVIDLGWARSKKESRFAVS